MPAKPSPAHLKLLKALTSLPTAPFFEHAPIAFIEDFARQRGLKVSRDSSGNRLIQVGKGRRPRTVFVAHLDHPGLEATGMEGKLATATFRGGVRADHMADAPVRFFTPHGEVKGHIKTVDADEHGRALRVTVAVKKDVPAGAFGMFDLGTAKVIDGRLHSRVCDDLAGVAAVLAAMDHLARNPPAAPVAALLTRGEEEGFIGSLTAVISPQLLRESDLVISVETSAQQPAAPMGGGATVRVGDRTSVFNSAYTRFITQQAEALAASDKTFAHQRALMPGGTCEATVFDAWGYTTAALCVPLGHYHNMDTTAKTIAAEFIDLADWTNLVKLLSRVGEQGHTFQPGFPDLRRRLQDLHGRLAPLLDRKPIVR